MGRGGNKEVKTEGLFLVIEGRRYDATDFVKKHPGGNIIKFLAGEDATEAFAAFHSRSELAAKYLKSLPSVQVEATEDSLSKDFAELRESLKKRGYFEPAPLHIAMRTLEIFVLFGLAYFLFSTGWYWSGVFILGLVQGRGGWYMHEGGHYSLTGNIKIDRILQLFGYNVVSGMSAGYWRNQHNKHHAAPQKLEHDVDLQTLPLIAFHKQIAEKGNPLWLRFQAFLWACPITLLVTCSWGFFLHPRFVWRRRMLGDAVAYAIRYSICAIIISKVGFWPFFKALIGSYWVVGTYVFTLFAVSHTHKGVLQADQHLDWVRNSVLYTTNIKPSWFVNWLMGYLNFQIEHHLFPSMPQFRFPEVSKEVQALCRKHNLPYDVRTLPQALVDTFSNLHHVGQPDSKQH